MSLLNAQSRLNFPSVLSLSLFSLLSVGLLSGCSEDTQQKANDMIENAKESAEESMKKAQDAVKESVDEASKKVEDVSESVTDSVTETVEETYEKAKSLSATESPILLAANTPSGADLYKTCVGCHGATGQGGVGPRLVGRDLEQMLTNLKTYREGGQVGPMSSLMTPYVKSFSDAELKTLVDYIAEF